MRKGKDFASTLLRNNSCDETLYSFSAQKAYLHRYSSNLNNYTSKESNSTAHKKSIRKNTKSASSRIIHRFRFDNYDINTNIIYFIASNTSLITQNNQHPINNVPLGRLYTDIFSKQFTINSLIHYLNKHNEQGVIDTLINSLYERHINASFFYIPQLCSMIAYKNSIGAIENYLLDCCSNKIKFSIIIYWIVSANSVQTKIEDLLNKIEMTLVNCRRATFSTFNSFIWSKAQSEYDVIQLSVNKEMRLNYFNMVIQFYEEIKLLCEALKDIKRIKRNDHLRTELILLKRKISDLYLQLDDMLAINDVIRNMYRGFLLPFDDHQSVQDDCCNIIVGVLPELSFCFNTKARVPIKITVECIRVYECDQWDKLHVEQCKNVNGNGTNNGSSNQKSNSSGKIHSIVLTDFNSKEEYDEVIKIRDKALKVKQQQVLNQKEIDKILKDIKYANDNPKNEDKTKKTYLLKEKQSIKLNQLICDYTPEAINLFGDKWSDVVQKHKADSEFKNFESYSLMSFIAKSNDDLRQEVLAMQIIKQFDWIFRKADLPLRLQPYEIIVTSDSSGLIEFLPNSISIDCLKKKMPFDWTLNIFYRKFYGNNFEEAQKNFAESLAAYSILTYLIDIKDRHNGNILIDIDGNIIHIDFGFILGISPGNMNFESAPFKLTSEYIELLDGVNSNIFQYFKSLLMRGMIEIRKNYNTIFQLIDIMGRGEDTIPCFIGKNIDSITSALKSRFKFDINDFDYYEFIDELINASVNNWRTTQYDRFQKYTNNISP